MPSRLYPAKIQSNKRIHWMIANFWFGQCYFLTFKQFIDFENSHWATDDFANSRQQHINTFGECFIVGGFWHVKWFDVGRETTQHDWFIDGVGHFTLWCLWNILRMTKQRSVTVFISDDAKCKYSPHRTRRKYHRLWWHCSLSAIWLRRRSAFDGTVYSEQQSQDWILSRSGRMVISKRDRQHRKSNLRCDRAIHRTWWRGIRLRRDWTRQCDGAYGSPQRDSFVQCKIHRPAMADKFPNIIVSFASNMLLRCKYEMKEKKKSEHQTQVNQYNTTDETLTRNIWVWTVLSRLQLVFAPRLAA